MVAASSLFHKVRRRLPLNAQTGLRWVKYKFSQHPLWDHPEFVRYLKWLEESQWWSKQEYEAYQLEKLQKLVKHAYENVPYYRRVFDQHKVKPDDIVTLADIQKLPVLTKDDVRNNAEDLIARNVDRSTLKYRTTSGSTGIPLGVYQDKDFSYLHELGHVYRQRRWAGWEFGDRYFVLRGNAPPEAGTKGRSHWYSYNLRDNALFLSSYDMTEENMFQYQQKIEEFRPKFVHGDSSSMEILSRFMKRNGIENKTVKAIFLGSQTIFPYQRSFIQDTFKCPVYARYGMTEKAIDAVQCEQHNGYHVGMEYGVFELFDQNNQPVTQAGVPGRVAGTGFDTYPMPLIRYVTDDIAEYSADTCACKRQATLVSDFKGRLGELVFSKSGYIVPLSPVYASIHGNVVAKIREMKFVQEREGELLVRVVKAPAFTQEEVEKEFLAEVFTKLSEEEFNVTIEFVDHLARTGRGKLGLLDQRLPVKVEHMDSFGGTNTGMGIATK